MSSSASSRVEIVPAARSSAIRSSHSPISGPAGSPSSSPRRSGSAGSPARASAIARSSSASPPANRAASSAHGSVARRKRWIARGDRSGELGAKQLAGVAPQLVRDRQLPEAVAEHRDEPHVGRRVAERPEALERTAERREQPELVESLEAGSAEADELREDPLARRLRDEPRARLHEPLRLRIEPEAELVLEADRAQQAERVVAEDSRRDRAKRLAVEVAEAAERIQRLAALERPRDRVDREVAGGEVLVDAVRQGREVDGALVGQRHAPGSVALREGNGAPSERRA